MKHYLLHTPGGDIIQWGRAADPAAQARPGLLAIEITAEQHAAMAPALQHVVDGQLVLRQPAQRDAVSQWVRVRARRAALLADCDWVLLRAIETGDEVPTPWSAYRQALRDITEQQDPFSISWPTPPSG